MVTYYLAVNGENVGDCTRNVEDGVNHHLNTLVAIAYKPTDVVEVWRRIRGVEDRCMYTYSWILKEFVEMPRGIKS